MNEGMDVRPDLKESREALDRVKAALVYKDEDELDTGMQKVQPLPFLDEEITKYRDQIEAAVSGAKLVKDDVPEKLLSKVDHVIHMATEGKTTLFKASELLEFTSEAFQYARRAALDKFDLSRESGKTLDSYDQSFSQLIGARMEAKMDQAQDSEESCLHYLEQAVREAERDCEDWKKRSHDEEGQLEKIGALEKLEEEVRDSISDEVRELEMIKKQCDKDCRSIDQELRGFKERFERATAKYREKKKSNEKTLAENKAEQKKLRERLDTLKKEEIRLERELKEGESQDQETESAKEKAEEGVKGWKDRIVVLQQRVDTSLQVMKEMSDVTGHILKDAQRKQRGSEEKLAKLEVESLLAKRDAIIAQGVMYKLIEFDCQASIKDNQNELEKLEKEKKKAARQGSRQRVTSITTTIEEYTTEVASFEEKCKDAKTQLELISKELEVADQRLRKLKPHLKLDRLEDRYKERKRNRDKAFEEDNMNGVEFFSKGCY